MESTELQRKAASKLLLAIRGATKPTIYPVNEQALIDAISAIVDVAVYEAILRLKGGSQ